MNLKAILHWLGGLAARLRFWRRNPTGWLSEMARARMRDARKASGPRRWREIVRQIAVPGLKTLWAICVLFGISFLASFGLVRWNPATLRIGGSSELSNAFTAMWQVQAGIAAVALPILLFAIELSRDQRQIALRTHEVLIRETWIFPIIVFSIAGTMRIGGDISWFGKEIVFLFDLLLVFCLTLLFTLFAYFRALALLFNPAKLKTRAMKVAREKMQESLESSIEARLANSILFEKLEDLKLGALFRPAGYQSGRFLTLRATRPGLVTDINLPRLEQFVRDLPRSYPRRAFRLTSLDLAINEPISPPLPAGTTVWFLVSYSQTLTRERNDVLCLQKNAFDEALLDVGDLESQLAKIIKIRPADEN